ncbi:hypothetical protein MIB92_04525 [Aestuariirhabdus sp. Z084]|uniref:hypothetical protein n=1 Tax=Aestuariirhabdus haliotis TaxID=2918751 RepID=UPI00201B3A60|nr:hypothetical protein [Aestuariirhabdus haliotis]MCL6414905.1 hypothetical protein [Aestuariirhabdus haliotis]MCL6418837.1 hypothetical protein [Aestuariirhabdus haliotis]
MMNVPTNLQDAKDLLTKDGFAVGSTWYHGTSSTLLASIEQQGLKRSGDKALKQTTKQIMATIGNSYTETVEPVFLTQSKELAFYWATQTVKQRAAHTGIEEAPAVLAINLPEEINTTVKPDVGAASLLLVEGNDYLEYLANLYKEHGFDAPVMNPAKSDRLDYLNKLGMAYINADIDAEHLQALT